MSAMMDPSSMDPSSMDPSLIAAMMGMMGAMGAGNAGAAGMMQGFQSLDITRAYGPTTLGCSADFILMGVIASQITTYFERSWGREPVLNSAVLLLGLFTLGSAILNIAALWSEAVEPLMSPKSWLFRGLLVEKLYATRLAFTGARVVGAQLVFIYRLALLSKWTWFCTALGLATTGIFFLVITPLAIISQGKTIVPLAGSSQSAGFAAISDYASAGIEAFLAIDIIIVAGLTYTLYKHKRLTTNVHTESLLMRIAAGSLSNAGICALLNAATVVALRTQPLGATIHDFFISLTAVTFTIALLFSLNQRASLLRAHDPSQQLSGMSTQRTKRKAPTITPTLVDITSATTSDFADEKRWASCSKSDHPYAATHSLEELHHARD